jgi:hypothetical protein
VLLRVFVVVLVIVILAWMLGGVLRLRKRR